MTIWLMGQNTPFEIKIITPIQKYHDVLYFFRIFLAFSL
jgi:hypothetical protein